MKTLHLPFDYLFADDCVIYKSITSLEDAEQLQEDLYKICEWTNKWQMKLNIDKCAVLRCTHSRFPYNMHIL